MTGKEPPTLSISGFLKGALGSLLILVLFFLLVMSGRSIWLFELPYHLIAGGILHAGRAISHFSAHLPALMKAAALPCMAAAVALRGAHRLILWWRREKGKDAYWSFRHTALAGSLVLLGSAAAIALSGVLHALAWLPQAPIIQDNHRSELTYAMANARTLGICIFEHEEEHKRLPLSLMDLDKIIGYLEKIDRLTLVDLDYPHPPEPFVLLKPGKDLSGNPSEMLMISPPIPEIGKFVVLRADGSVTTLPSERFEEIVRTATSDAKSPP